MPSSSGYASMLLHQLQPRDMMAPITRGMPNDADRDVEWPFDKQNISESKY